MRIRVSLLMYTLQTTWCQFRRPRSQHEDETVHRMKCDHLGILVRGGYDWTLGTWESNNVLQVAFVTMNKHTLACAFAYVNLAHASERGSSMVAFPSK